MPAPIRYDGKSLDLTGRYVASTTVAASPAAATETIIATVTVPGDVSVLQGIEVVAWAAFTVGASGTAANLRIRLTNVSGTVKSATGATTVTAANLVERSAAAFDATGTAGAVYVATLEVTAGAAASTVSGVLLRALVV